LRVTQARSSLALIALVSVLAAVAADARDDADDLIRRARRDIDAGRYAQAESSLVEAARIGRGDDRDEALFLRAGLTRSAEGAQRIYEELVDGGDRDWADPAALELAKIHFAMGRYEAAREVLRRARVSDHNDEAALVEGLASVMVRDWDAARTGLERIRRGRYRTWAAVSLAEAEAGAGDEVEACRMYESLARARVNPAAWYRYAECLEKDGDRDGARREYAALENAYPQTPEAIRAAGKHVPPEAAVMPPPDKDNAAKIPPGKGYTIQFGSFGDRANAIRLSSRIKEEYPGVRIDSELVNFREVFRVRFGYYASREEADAAARDMAARMDERYTIMPVRPRP
jgi:tetratricopeptide (TPR) repeat protein